MADVPFHMRPQAEAEAIIDQNLRRKGVGRQVEVKPVTRRKVVLTPASAIKPKRVRWLWEERLPHGMMALLAGRQGLGKSSVAYWLTAQITLGALRGEFYKKPKSVLIAATEDSWEHVIVPRLMAADANLDRVYRIEVETAEGLGELSLPKDNEEMKEIALEVEAALMVLDPLMSRLSGTLDSHKDAEVRQALEPLVKIGSEIGMTTLGLIHHNKSAQSDPVQAVMGSTAFTSVVRSVHTVVQDPRDEDSRLFGVVKSNVGRTDIDTLGFNIEEREFEVDDGLIKIGAVEWTGAAPMSIASAMAALIAQGKPTTAGKEAEDWVFEYLISCGGEARAARALEAGKEAGHTGSALRRGREQLQAKGKLQVEKIGYPAESWWKVSRLSGGGELIDDISSTSVPHAETEVSEVRSPDTPRTSVTSDDGVVRFGEFGKRAMEGGA